MQGGPQSIVASPISSITRLWPANNTNHTRSPEVMEYWKWYLTHITISNTHYPHSIQKLGLAKKRSNSKHKGGHMSTMHLRTSRLSAIELNIWKISELLLWGTITPQPVLLFCFVGCCDSQLQYSKDYKRGSWIEWNAKMGFIDMCFRVGATFEWSFNLHWLWGCSRLSQNMHPSRKTCVC